MQELIEKINERKIKLWIGLDGELHYRAPKVHYRQDWQERYGKIRSKL